MLKSEFVLGDSYHYAPDSYPNAPEGYKKSYDYYNTNTHNTGIFLGVDGETRVFLYRLMTKPIPAPHNTAMTTATSSPMLRFLKYMFHIHPTPQVGMVLVDRYFGAEETQITILAVSKDGKLVKYQYNAIFGSPDNRVAKSHRSWNYLYFHYDLLIDRAPHNIPPTLNTAEPVDMETFDD
jgi:hypothetical protein